MTIPMIWFLLSLLLIAQRFVSAASTSTMPGNDTNRDQQDYLVGIHLTPIEIEGIFGRDAFSAFHNRTSPQDSTISGYGYPTCTTNATSPDIDRMLQAYEEFTRYWGFWCGGTGRAPVDADGFQTIMWKQAGCAGLGIHCKSDAKYGCRDMALYFNKIIKACNVAFFGGTIRVSGEQDIENVGNMGTLWMENVCAWFPPKEG